jgi:hypothetical protein
MKDPQSGKTFLSRRQALKALIALGGASTLSALPNKWKEPVIEVGALPALAQISPMPTMTPTTTPMPAPTSSPTPGPTPTPGACSDDSPAVISNLSVSERLAGCNPGGGEPGDLFTISLAYSDPCGLTPNQASMRLAFEFLPSQFTEVEQVLLGPANITGSANGFVQGTLSVPLCIVFGSDVSVNLTVSVINTNGITSNELTIGIANPGLNSAQGGLPRVSILAP